MFAPFGFVIIFILSVSPPLFARDGKDPIAERVHRAGNPYDVLGLGSGADRAAIRRAHIELARRYQNLASQGNPEATKVMQKVNAANTFLTKDRVTGERSGGWYYSDGSTSNNSSGSAAASNSRGQSQSQSQTPDVWAEFWEKMRAADTKEERHRLRTQQLKHVTSASDFLTVAKSGVDSYKGDRAAETKDFAVKHMADFLRYSPRLTELNQLARVGSLVPGGQAEIYNSAFQSAKTPHQVISMMTPQLSGGMGGGDRWIKDFKESSEKHLYRFFLMKPSAAEVGAIHARLMTGFNHDGERIMYESMQKAEHVISGKPAETYRKSFFGSASGFWGRFVNRFASIDPTLVSGVVVGLVEASEAESLKTFTCPPGLLKTPRLMTEGYIQMYVLLPQSEQATIEKNCEMKSEHAALKLKTAVGLILSKNMKALAVSPESLKCQDPRGISFTSTNGYSTQIKFKANGDVETIQVTPSTGKGNPNHFLSFSPNQAGQSFKYSSFEYSNDKVVEAPATAYDSETSFFLRLVCLREMCSHIDFIKNTQTDDTSQFSLDLQKGKSPTHKAPFGDMKVPFLETSGRHMHGLISLIRRHGAGPELKSKICQDLQRTDSSTKPPVISPTATDLEATGRD